MLVIVATFRRLVRPILVSLESHNCLLCLRCLASPSLLRPLLQRPGLNTLSLPQWLCSLSGRSSVRRYASDRLSRVQFGLDRGFCRASFCQPATSFLAYSQPLLRCLLLDFCLHPVLQFVAVASHDRRHGRLAVLISSFWRVKYDPFSEARRELPIHFPADWLATFRLSADRYPLLDT